MGLTLSERKAITRTLTKRYVKAPRAEKSKILDEVCELCEEPRSRPASSQASTRGSRQVQTSRARSHL